MIAYQITPRELPFAATTFFPRQDIKNRRALSIKTWASRKGFTLIEILIVLVIISIIAGVALLSLSHNHKKEVETTAHALATSIALVEEEAILKPGTFGLALTNTSYQFFISENDVSSSWKALSDRFLKQHTIPPSVQISLKIQDEVIPLDGKPRIIFSPNGDITPFIIFVGEQGKPPLFQIIGSSNGEVKSDEMA